METQPLFTRIKQSRCIIATHVYGTGASQDLVRYFVSHKAREVLFIGHPLFYDPHLDGSVYDLYISGKRTVAYREKNRPTPLLLGYFIHMMKSFIWSMRRPHTWDLYIGSNNVNAFVGLLLKRFGKVTKVVYYVIDYNPVRYANPLLNKIYHWLDQYCVIHADETWNMSPRMAEGRKTYFQFTGGNQKTVPVGLWICDIPKKALSYDPHALAFLGHVQKKQGIQYVIDAIPLIVQSIPDFRFVILGGGDYLSSLKDQVQKLTIKKYVEFTGYIKDHQEIESRLQACGAGVALYDKKDGGKISFSYFGNPTKIKTYLFAGLPILISDVPYNAKELQDAGCGMIISYEARDIADAVIRLLKDPKVLVQYRNAVICYRKQFDWESIFSNNLNHLL